MINDEHSRSPEGTDLLEYRLGKVEEGVEKINAKLDGIANGFATQTQLANAVKERDQKIAAIYADGKEYDARLQKVERFIDGIVKKIAGSAVFILVVMLLAIYGLDKFLK